MSESVTIATIVVAVMGIVGTALAPRQTEMGRHRGPVLLLLCGVLLSSLARWLDPPAPWSGLAVWSSSGLLIGSAIVLFRRVVADAESRRRARSQGPSS